MDFPTSSKNIWIVLSGTSLMRSREFIGSMLQQNAAKLFLGYSYYSDETAATIMSSQSARDLIAQLKNNDIVLKVIDQLKKFLNLSEHHCEELFYLYLINQFKGLPSQVKQLCNLEKNNQCRIYNLNDFYYSERLFTMFALKHIIIHSDPECSHPYRAMFKDFLDAYDKDDKLFNNFVKQYEELITAKMPPKNLNDPHIQDKILAMWPKHNVQEQIELLETMMVYFDLHKPSLEQIIIILNLFDKYPYNKNCSNDSNNANAGNDQEIKLEIQFIMFLQSILLVQTLDLERLTRCMLDDLHNHHLLEDDSNLVKLNTLLINPKSLSNQSKSPLSLGWMIVRSWQLSAFPDHEQSGSDVQKLIAATHRSKVFSFMKSFIDGEGLDRLKNTRVWGIIYETIRILLNSLFELYDISSMNQESSTSIEILIQSLLKSDKTAGKIITESSSNSLGKLLSQSWIKFPYSLNPYVSCHLSLAKTTCSYQAFKTMKNLNTYSEIMDARNLKLQPIGHDGEYRLLENHRIYKDDSLIIKANTIGHMTQDASFPIITWKNVSLDAWDILRHSINEKINFSSFTDFSQLRIIEFNEISSVAELCYEVLKRLEPSMCSQVLLLIQSCHIYFDALVQHRRPPRLYMASCLKLISIQMHKKVLNVKNVISNLQGKRFMPYMIGLTHNLSDISLGKDTNSSTIGELIASEECIRGSYELCLAFLEFISVIINNIEYEEENQLVLASLVYILNEIYPSHHLWNYTSKCDMENIKKHCIGIFHKILSNIDKVTTKSKNSLQIVCIISLTQNESHKQLLETIKSGDSVIKCSINYSGSDIDLSKTKHIIMLRQSLMVFNYLLAHTNTAEEYCNLSPDSNEKTQDTSQTIASPHTELEKVLFSTNLRPGFLSNLLFYVYQQYDSTLACIAIQLIKRIAKKFSLSLMACLGSEAESICEFFLARLSATAEDVDLKVAILDLLSVCINHQPGLMEMFLGSGGSSEEVNGTSNSLSTVMNIFEDSQANQLNHPKHLHVSALKFVFTFWQRHHSAVNSLTKLPNFWKLVTFPLNNLSNSENGLSNDKLQEKLYAYIFMLLAREIFFLVGISSERKISPGLSATYEIISKDDILRKYSLYVNSMNSDKDDCHSRRSNIALVGWRDFLVSFLRYQPFEITNNTKECIMHDLLTNLTELLRTDKNCDKERLALVGEILLLVGGKWLSSKKSTEETYKTFHKLLYLVDESKEQLPFAFLLSFQSTICVFFLRQREELSKLPGFSDLMVPTVQIVKFNLQLFEKYINTAQTNLYSSVESRLCLSSIVALRFIIDIGRKNVTLWLSYLQTNLKVDVILQFIVILLERRRASDVCYALVELLICLSSIKEGADYLNSTNIVGHLNMVIVSAYQEPQQEMFVRSWVHVYHQIIRLNISLMTTLEHRYLDTAINFLTIHCTRICETLEKVRYHLSSIDIEESQLSISLISLLSQRQGLWIRQNQQCFDAISEEVSKTTHSVVAFYIRPSFLQYILENPSKSVATMIGAINKNVNKNQNASGVVKNKNVTSTNSDEDARWNNLISKNATHNQLETFQASLMDLLSVLLTFIYNFSPTVFELISKQGLGKSSWKHTLSISFGIPTLDPATPLTYGSLLQSFSYCVKRYDEIEKDKGGASLSRDREKQTLMYIQERSLSILISQALLVYFLDDFTARDRQLISREIKAELGSAILELNGQQEPLNKSATVEAYSTKNLPSQLNKPYMKCLLQLVEKTF